MPGKIISVDWDQVRRASAIAAPAADPPQDSNAADDPFFTLPDESTWNACVGKQGDEEHYLDGYMEAAIQLADDVIEKKMYEKRDTLVLPILYNARHAVELALKFVTDRLEAAGLMEQIPGRDHDIKTYWCRLDAASLGDEKLRQTLQALKPFSAASSRTCSGVRSVPINSGGIRAVCSGSASPREAPRCPV